MYRINFNREYFARRKAAKMGLLWTASFSAILAVEAGLLGLLIVSSFLLGGRVRSLRDEVGRIAARVENASRPRPELGGVRQLDAVRRARVDWAPKLAGLSRDLGPSLILVGLKCQLSAGGRPPQMEIVGQIRGTASDMGAVGRVTVAVRADDAVNRDLPNVRLGTLGGDLTSRFQIVCEAPESAP